MTVNVREIYGYPRGVTIQVRGQVNGEPRAYNVNVFGPLSIPRWLMVRRSSWAGREGDREGLPI